MTKTFRSALILLALAGASPLSQGASMPFAWADEDWKGDNACFNATNGVYFYQQFATTGGNDEALSWTMPATRYQQVTYDSKYSFDSDGDALFEDSSVPAYQCSTSLDFGFNFCFGDRVWTSCEVTCDALRFGEEGDAICLIDDEQEVEPSAVRVRRDEQASSVTVVFGRQSVTLYPNGFMEMSFEETMTNATIAIRLARGQADPDLQMYCHETAGAGGGPLCDLGFFRVGLPPGLAFEDNAGVLAGYPTSTGDYYFDVAVRDGFNQVLSNSFCLCVAEAEEPEYPGIYVSAEWGDDAFEGSISAPYKTIERALSAAEDGDEIYLMPGTYDAIDLRDDSRTLYIIGFEGPDETIISGGWSNRCVTGYSSQNTFLQGVTLSYGWVTNDSCGGGVTDANLYNCRIFACHSELLGAGAYNCHLDQCLVQFCNLCQAENSTESAQGGGLYGCTATNCVIRNNTISQGANATAPCAGSGAANSTLTDCRVYGNSIQDYGDPPFAGLSDANLSGLYADSICENVYAWGNWYGNWSNVTTQNVSACEGVQVCEYEPAQGYVAIIGVSDVLRDEEVLLTANALTNFMVGVSTASSRPLSVQLRADGELLNHTEIMPQAGALGVPLAYWGTVSGASAVSRVHWVRISVCDAFGDELDSFEFSVRLRCDWYVDASVSTGDYQDGSQNCPYETMNFNVADADVIHVAAGVYQTVPQCFDNDACLTFVATDSLEETKLLCSMDCTGTNYVFRGFTVADTVRGGQYIGCLIRPESQNPDSNWFPPCATGSLLVNCALYGGFGFGAEDSTLYNCTVTGNAEGGITNCVAYNSIIWDNGTLNAPDSDCVSCITSADPLLVDPANGDFRLRAGSPCLNDADLSLMPEAFLAYPALNGEARVQDDALDIGACEGDAVSGCVIRCQAVGAGYVWVAGGAVVEPGTDVTVYFGGRPLDYITVDGERMEDVWGDSYTIENVQADFDVVVHFLTQDFYVDCENGDDAGDGTSKAPFKTVAQAVSAVAEGETIYLMPGTYDAIDLRDDNRYLSIVGLDGADVTFIDGGGTKRCVTGYSTEKTYFEGLTLQNGRCYAQGVDACGEDDGGGAKDARLCKCHIQNCEAGAYGGGAYNCDLQQCLVENCFVKQAADSEAAAMGGGVYFSTASNCVLRSNGVYRGDGATGICAGGAAAYSTLIDCRVYGNILRDLWVDPPFSDTETVCLSALYSCWIGTGVYAWDNAYGNLMGETPLNVYSCDGEVNEFEPQLPDVQIVEVEGAPEDEEVVLSSGDMTNFTVWVENPSAAPVTLKMYVDDKIYGRSDVQPSAELQNVPFYYGDWIEGTADVARVRSVYISVCDAVGDELDFCEFEVRLRRDWYVSASVSDGDYQDGSQDNPYRAMDFYVDEGDVVYVRKGAYDYLPYFSDYDAHVTFVAEDFPEETKLAWTMSADGTNLVYRGFTVGDIVIGGLYVDCIIRPNPLYYAGDWASPSAYKAVLVNCALYGGFGFGAEKSTLYNCTVTGNAEGGVTNCVAYNSIIWDNGALNVSADSHLESCITSADPRLVDPANGDFRLRAGSPCLNDADLSLMPEAFLAYPALNGEARVQDGALDIGACAGDAVSGCVIRHQVVGAGWVSSDCGWTVETGETATVSFGGRPIGFITVNGTQIAVSGDSYTLEDIRSDIDLVAYFMPQNFFVDGTAGDDDRDGTSSDAAFRTVARALLEAADGETVYLLPGVYPPILMEDDMRHLRFVSLEGNAVTFIDGGGTNRCAAGSLDTMGASCTVLAGLTLTNGYDSYYGGGACYVLLTNCVITGCRAGSYGGGAAYCELADCQVVSNSLFESVDGGAGLYACKITGFVYAWDNFIVSGSTGTLSNHDSCSGLKIYTYDPSARAVTSVADLANVFGADSEVAREITSQVQLNEFNQFMGELNLTAADMATLTDGQKQNAYASFQLSSLMAEPALLASTPEITVDEIAFDDSGNLAVSVSLKAGEAAIAMAAAKLAEAVRVGTSPDNITGDPDVCAAPDKDGSTLTLTIAPPGTTCGFIRVNVSR